eukprot:CAMPEP_0178457328 /NCGR_PEP_ID=MMETSP0689_2-20121128/46959_1 /TAXON_ID=160604 /ORGANISM="Amphidinium massartii, Strain CS-259" /LENGTH=363 /DNA_ID=CAMNT_0020083573 /DNA_START=50 /DNA_END=1139 /DNA_ORIENTATION=-
MVCPDFVNELAANAVAAPGGGIAETGSSAVWEAVVEVVGATTSRGSFQRRFPQRKASIRGKGRSEVKFPCPNLVLLESKQQEEKDDTAQIVVPEVAATEATTQRTIISIEVESTEQKDYEPDTATVASALAQQILTLSSSSALLDIAAQQPQLRSTILGMLIAEAGIQSSASYFTNEVESDSKLCDTDNISDESACFRPPPGLDCFSGEDDEPCSQQVNENDILVAPTKKADPRRVNFNMEANTLHEITPYSEIYGLHPREFVFDRHFHMIPSAGDHGFVGIGGDNFDEEEDDDCDSDVSENEEWIDMDVDMDMVEDEMEGEVDDAFIGEPVRAETSTAGEPVLLAFADVLRSESLSNLARIL